MIVLAVPVFLESVNTAADPLLSVRFSSHLNATHRVRIVLPFKFQLVAFRVGICRQG